MLQIDKYKSFIVYNLCIYYKHLVFVSYSILEYNVLLIFPIRIIVHPNTILLGISDTSPQVNNNVLTENTNTVCISQPSLNTLVLEPSVSNTVSIIEETPRRLSTIATMDSNFAEPSVYITSTTTSCMQCRMIDMDLNLDTLHYSTATIINTPSEYNCPPRSSHHQDEWQVANIMALNCNDVSLNSIEYLPETSRETEIDTTSFIVVRDDTENKNQFLSSGLKNRKEIPPISHISPFINMLPSRLTDETNFKMSSQQRCSDCCFCNPDLHKRSRSISSNCSYCNRLNEKWKTASPRLSSQNDTFHNKSTNTKPQQFFETQSKTDHTHIRTRSKDSDTVSLKCTKINTKLHRYLPEDMLNGNVFEETFNGKDERAKCSQKSTRPPKVPVITTMSVTSPVSERKLKTTAETTTKTPRSATKSVRLPSPFINNANSTSTHSYDSATSTSSSQCSSSLSSSPVSPNKRVSTIPVSRWHNHNSAGVLSSREQTLPAIVNNNIRKSRYQHFYGQSKSGLIDANQLDVKENMVSSGKNVQTSVNQQSSGNI